MQYKNSIENKYIHVYKYSDIHLRRLFPAYLEASSGRKAERVPTNNQRDDNQDLVASKKVWTRPDIQMHRFDSQSAF